MIRVDRNILLVIAASILFVACGEGSSGYNASDTLTEEQRHLPENATSGLTVAEDLEVQLMASEPMLMNPTNIDVDDRGRIWITEAFNYRPGQSSTTIPQGDRIMILEDRNGDGKIDSAKVFYQGPEVNAPLGICLVGNKVIVSQSPFVWAFYDDNGDDVADRKEIVFQNISGVQHDHGMHAFTTGPDGKLYFNFGNEGKSLRDKNNKVVLDQFGDSIGSSKYKQGMVFRCDPDFTNIERMGHNFRNNYEVAVDSYGTMWQSDNDDDGNRGVRINYVMDYGNFGYTDEMTGAWWTTNRTNIEDSIPYRHWHLNDPGVVPNILQTGSGSPTGMIVYEGSLLPEKFRNQMIHCEAGHNVVRAYPVKKDGAGYTPTIENVLVGEKDQWFRPSDVCVAPDGSLIIADWYDPVVGGHDAKDKESGRIYRVAPKGSAYKMPVIGYDTPEAAVMALQNPNLVVRRKAWLALQSLGSKAVPALEQLWHSEDSRMRARAFWALAKLPGGEKYINEAITDNDADLRIAGVRAARQIGDNKAIEVVNQLKNDKDPQVRREASLALHRNKAASAPQLWAELAAHHKGQDRWYLEALGIGAADQWDRFFEVWLKENSSSLNSPGNKDIIWRARTDKSLPYLVKLAGDSSIDLKARLRYFRAFDFNPSPAKTEALIGMIRNNGNTYYELNAVILQGMDPQVIQRSSIARNALNNVLKESYGTSSYIELTRQYQVKSQIPKLIGLALDRSEEQIASDAVSLAINLGGANQVVAIAKGKDQQKASKMLTALGFVGNNHSVDALQSVLLGKNYSDSLRNVAARNIGKTYHGENVVFNLLKANKIPDNLIPPTLAGLEYGPRRSMLIQIKDFLDQKVGKVKAPFDRDSVLALTGNVSNGLKVFKTNCSICHQVGGEGTDFGPKLTEIGSKLPKNGLLDAIMTPSAGISFGYETVELKMNNGNSIIGVLGGKTESDIDIKLPGGQTQKVKTSEIKTITKSPESMMPALHEAMTKQELADLLAYLSTLEKE